MLSMHSRLLAKIIVALVTLFSTQISLAAGDPARGEKLAYTCRGCHAVESYNNVFPTYHVPKLAGQNADYTIAALTLYRDGQRKHATMTAQAASLSDQDIQDIAAYFAAAGGELESAAEAQAPEAAQVCAACHGQAGISPIPTNPNLAGQYVDYLEQAIAQYKRGDRKGPNAILMQAQVAAVSDEDLAAIASYFAAQQGLDTL
ncbi:MAG: c-type cytochrome [Gammaproteobacteria bacterium]|jgi:cytochrome c553